MKHSITRHIKPEECIQDMIKFHKENYARLYNQGNSQFKRLNQRERLALHNQALVHKEMYEFWETVTFEKLKEDTYDR